MWGLRIRDLLIIGLGFLVLQGHMQDVYKEGVKTGHQWGYESGVKEGLKQCPLPFVKSSA